MPTNSPTKTKKKLINYQLSVSVVMQLAVVFFKHSHSGNVYENFRPAVLICCALITPYASSHQLMNNQV